MDKRTNIKIAVIEQRDEWREKLVTLVESTPGLFCAGNYGAIKDALIEFSRNLPDAVLCNFAPSDVREKKVINALRRKFHALPILVLNLYGDEKCVPETPSGLSVGCLLKLSFPARLLQNVRASGGKDSGFPNLVDLFALISSSSVRETADYDLTPHEIRLLKMLVEGHTQTTAATVLNISYNTVKFHMRRIYQKLDVNTKSAAVAKAIRSGLIS
jgi:DNA-binding NarL/FixJ family response regulator